MKEFCKRLNITKFEYWYFFMIIIYSGMATPIFRSMMFYNNNIIMFLIPIIMSFFLIKRKKILFSRNFFISIGILSMWIGAHFIKYKEDLITLSFFLLYNLFVSYTLVACYQSKLVVLYEYFIVKLSFIGLILWVLVTLLPQIMDPLLMSLNIGGAGESVLCKSNLIIFSLTDYGNNPFIYFVRRNAGFAWEPGRYAIMILPALFFNLLINNFKYNKNLLILFLSLLSTNSTTGIVSMSIIFIFYLMNSKKKIISYIILLPLVFFLFIINTTVEEKIQKNKSEGFEKIDEVSDALDYYNAKNEEATYSLQRFDAIKVQFLSFVNDPILGYGPNEVNAYFKTHIHAGIRAPNGNVQIFAKYGILLGILIFIMLYKSSKKLTHIYKCNGKYMYFLLFIIISTSYSLANVPIFLAFIMYFWYTNKPNKDINNKVQNL